MLEIPTFREIRIQAQQDLNTEADGALRAALINAIAYALAGIVYLFFKTLQFLSRQLFLDQAEEKFALLWASIFGVDPTPATAATGEVQITGTIGSTWLGGEVLRRADGVEYTIDAPGEMTGIEEATVTVTAVEAGEDGNCDVDTDLVFVSPPAGIDAEAIVVDEDGLSGGFEVETPAAVQARALEQIRAPRRGGSEADYVIWAKQVSGVGAAYARGSFLGIGTVLVVIAQEWDPTEPGDTPVPSDELIAAVEEHFESLKPAGLHGVFVQPPTLTELDPYIALTTDTAEIRAAVERSLALALARVEPGNTAYYDDLVEAINRASGEEHHRLYVDDGSGNYGVHDTVVGYTHLLVPGTITWTEPP